MHSNYCQNYCQKLNITNYILNTYITDMWHMGAKVIKPLFYNGFHTVNLMWQKGGKRGAKGYFPQLAFLGKTPKKLRAKHSAPNAFGCIFGVILAQGKSPCSEATTDEAVFLLQFCFNSSSDGRSPKSPSPFSGMGSIRPARHLKGPLSGFWDKLQAHPLARAGRGLLRAFLS